jgi:ketosteroid isomerase-like protein
LATPEDDTQREIRRLYDAFNARDIEAVLGRLTSDVVWANGMEGGHLRGRPAVREYWLRQFETIHPHVEPEAITLIDGDRVAVTVHQVVRSLDGELIADQRVTHVYTFEERGISRFDIADDDGSAMRDGTLPTDA